MLLYTPVFHGLDIVVFTNQSAKKLASVGDLCDAGMVCVFNSEGLATYKQNDCEVSGNIFTTTNEMRRLSSIFSLSTVRWPRNQ